MHVAPGEDGADWRPFVRSRHFRVAEYAHLVNTEYVAGCPGSYFFGKSEFVPLKDLATSVAACFAPPFCASSGNSSLARDIERGDKRNLIFLGHDTLTDVKYLQNIGFDPLVLPNLLEAQDSASLFRVWQRQEQTTKLAKILENFDIDYYGLHNAGNDAMYTVQSFLAICVREASIRNSLEVQQVWDDHKESKIAFEQQELRSDIEKDAKVWDDLETHGDGGDPVPIVLKKPAISHAVPRPGKISTPAPVNLGGRNEKGKSNGTQAHHSGGGPGDGRGRANNSDGWGGKAAW
jgi:hypothetical protein